MGAGSELSFAEIRARAEMYSEYGITVVRELADEVLALVEVAEAAHELLPALRKDWDDTYFARLEQALSQVSKGEK